MSPYLRLSIFLLYPFVVVSRPVFRYDPFSAEYFNSDRKKTVAPPQTPPEIIVHTLGHSDIFDADSFNNYQYDQETTTTTTTTTTRNIETVTDGQKIVDHHVDDGRDESTQFSSSRSSSASSSMSKSSPSFRLATPPTVPSYCRDVRAWEISYCIEIFQKIIEWEERLDSTSTSTLTQPQHSLNTASTTASTPITASTTTSTQPRHNIDTATATATASISSSVSRQPQDLTSTTTSSRDFHASTTTSTQPQHSLNTASTTASTQPQHNLNTASTTTSRQPRDVTRDISTSTRQPQDSNPTTSTTHVSSTSTFELKRELNQAKITNQFLKTVILPIVGGVSGFIILIVIIVAYCLMRRGRSRTETIELRRLTSQRGSSPGSFVSGSFVSHQSVYPTSPLTSDLPTSPPDQLEVLNRMSIVYENVFYENIDYEFD